MSALEVTQMINSIVQLDDDTTDGARMTEAEVLEQLGHEGRLGSMLDRTTWLGGVDGETFSTSSGNGADRRFIGLTSKATGTRSTLIYNAVITAGAGENNENVDDVTTNNAGLDSQNTITNGSSSGAFDITWDRLNTNLIFVNDDATDVDYLL